MKSRNRPNYLFVFQRGMLVVWMVWIMVCTAASAREYEPEDPLVRDRYYALTHELRCLVCQNQSLAESEVDLAQELKRQIADMLEQGATNEGVKQYMVDRYGAYVLYDPPFGPRTWLLWLAPALFFVFGLWLLWSVVMRPARTGEHQDNET